MTLFTQMRHHGYTHFNAKQTNKRARKPKQQKRRQLTSRIVPSNYFYFFRRFSPYPTVACFSVLKFHIHFHTSTTVARNTIRFFIVANLPLLLFLYRNSKTLNWREEEANVRVQCTALRLLISFAMVNVYSLSLHCGQLFTHRLVNCIRHNAKKENFFGFILNLLLNGLELSLEDRIDWSFKICTCFAHMIYIYLIRKWISLKRNDNTIWFSKSSCADDVWIERRKWKK